MSMIRMLALAFLCLSSAVATHAVETLRHPATFESLLDATDPEYLADQAVKRGDPHRGAIVFFTSAAACINCHSDSEGRSPLGPNLAKLEEPISGTEIVQSILHPSAKIRKGYETVTLLTVDGTVHRGLVARENEEALFLREATDLENEIRIAKDDIEARNLAATSMMPEGLANVLGGQREFYDLVRYLMEISSGGEARAEELKPTADQLVPKDDSRDLDHAGIISRLRSRDFDAGKAIYDGYCFNCHGKEGNRPSLPTARAFGTQPLKFGSDPYRMFMTLTRGNGLMRAMSHLTPKERYQVVHYIREQFMKGANPDYFEVSDEYLESLPKGTKQGDEVPSIVRDYGVALASQLGREVRSALTVKLGNQSLAYNLHTMGTAGVWRGGFLELDETQHMRGRGEGTANPAGELIPGLAGWRWGHEGTLDYPREDLLPRGPLPKQWMDYHGYYLSGGSVALHYAIDGREVFERPRWLSDIGALSRTLDIGPGRELVLSVAALENPAAVGVESFSSNQGTRSQEGHAQQVAFVRTKHGDVVHRVVAVVIGDDQQLRWEPDRQGRLVLHIPADDRRRQIELICHSDSGDVAATERGRELLASAANGGLTSLQAFHRGGAARWPQVLKTVGYPGLEKGAYRLDTLTRPDATPWNTWFRTSALDFFDDGRMVLTTYGGDVWIVSEIDDQLLDLRWKRFAGGLYEPFGVKVVDGKIYVTCKDRLVRLHDLNGDDEADFYESFSADTDISANFHAFNFDLQVDSEGNFYYAKSGHGADFALPGAIVKVSPDGEDREYYCTGFRTPNGIGILPDDRITASDNQGQWTPASKISVVRPGGFYGWVQTYGIEGMWMPDGGRIDIEKVVPPETFDPPMIWMPQDFDNSSGGQVYAGDPRFGPVSGRLLHTSFGKGWLSYTMRQDYEGGTQAAIIKLPFDFQTGIMRARVNPADGQVYATGLDGWNGGGRPGLIDGGVQRLKYTGMPIQMVEHCTVEPDALRIDFNFALDPDSATDAASYEVTYWNYLWQASYGSEYYSPSTGEVGVEEVPIKEIQLSEDGRSVRFLVPGLKPVDQIHFRLHIRAADGTPFDEEIYWTVNHVPEANSQLLDADQNAQ